MVRLTLSSLAGLWLLLCLEISDAFSTVGRCGSPSFRSASSLSAAPRDNADQDGSSALKRRDFVIQSITAGVVSTVIPPFVKPALADDDNQGTETTSTIIDPSIDLPKITQKVYLDVKFAKYKTPNRLVIGLFGDAMPKTVENFVTLCSSTDGPSYSGTNFYRGMKK